MWPRLWDPTIYNFLDILPLGFLVDKTGRRDPKPPPQGQGNGGEELGPQSIAEEKVRQPKCWAQIRNIVLGTTKNFTRFFLFFKNFFLPGTENCCMGRRRFGGD